MRRDTLDDGVAQAICCTYLVSILFCLSSIVWFAFALGSKTQKTVFLAQNPNEFQHISVPLASDTQGTVVPSTISEDPAAYVREKIVIETSEGDTAQMIGFSMIAGSVGMFVLMVLIGIHLDTNVIGTRTGLLWWNVQQYLWAHLEWEKRQI